MSLSDARFQASGNGFDTIRPEPKITDLKSQWLKVFAHVLKQGILFGLQFKQQGKQQLLRIERARLETFLRPLI